MIVTKSESKLADSKSEDFVKALSQVEDTTGGARLATDTAEESQDFRNKSLISIYYGKIGHTIIPINMHF